MHTVNPDIIEAEARAMIDRYLSLPVGAHPSCPYFNNRRRGTKSGLRVLVGKGTPEEISEECEIRALQNRISIATLSSEKLKEFMVSQDIGIDCSGFAYHVLGAALHERRGGRLSSHIHTRRKGFMGNIIARLRPAENMGVATFADERNSVAITASEARAGDIITFIGAGRDGTYNHIIVITKVETKESATRLSYVHSYAWPEDGAFGHGVREGSVIVYENDLAHAVWKEAGLGTMNAKETTVRRLRAFMK
jgi:hypothetical protein